MAEYKYSGYLNHIILNGLSKREINMNFHTNKKLWIGAIALLLITVLTISGVKASSHKDGVDQLLPNNKIDNAVVSHTIKVNGEGTVKVVPDIGYINFAVSKREKTATEAMESLSKTANKVLNALKDFGISKENIKTTGMNLSPEYEWDKEKEKNVIVGFRAVENFSVKTKLDNIGKVIALIVDNEIDRVNNIRFDSSKREELEKEAIKKAMKDAKEKAEVTLTGTGYKITGIKTISVESNPFLPVLNEGLNAIFNKLSPDTVPIESGSMVIKTSVNVVFTFDK